MKLSQLYKQHKQIQKGIMKKPSNKVNSKQTKVPTTKTGLWNKQLNTVIIPSNKITMKGPKGQKDFFKKPVLGKGLQSGQTILMEPGKEYIFPDDKQVIEKRLQNGAYVRRDIYKDAERIADAEEVYLNSPEYRQLLQTEFYGPGSDKDVDPMIEARKENLKSLRVDVPYIPGLSIPKNVAAGYDPNYHKIVVRKDQYDPSVFRHELSHSFDSSYTPGADKVGDYFEKVLKEDLAKKDKSSIKEDIGDTTEFKARLKALRDKSIEEGYNLLEPGYDINKYKDSFSPMENMQYKQLRDAGLSDEEINKYMYLFAKQDTQPQMVTAQDGADIPVEIDALYSRYNKDTKQYMQDGASIPERKGSRANPDGTVSTHLMRAETLDGENWVAFPSLFQNADSSWVDMSQEEDWYPVYEEAKRRGEVIDFGKDKEKALEFGKGSWKKEMKEGGKLPELKSKMDIANFYKNPLSNKYSIIQNPDTGAYEYYLKDSKPTSDAVRPLREENIKKSYSPIDTSKKSPVILPDVISDQEADRRIIDSQIYGKNIGPALDPTSLPVPEPPKPLPVKKSKPRVKSAPKPVYADRFKNDRRQLPFTGFIVDRGTNIGYVTTEKGMYQFPVLTGRSTDPNSKKHVSASIQRKRVDPSTAVTPLGYYYMDNRVWKPEKYDGNIRTLRGFSAFGEPMRPGRGGGTITAVHQTFNPPVREPLYKKGSEARRASAGCVNCRRPDYERMSRDIQANDTLFIFDSRLPRDQHFIKELNKKKKIYQDGGHLVQKGETFYGIANKHNLSKQDLIDANPDIDIEAIKPGQKLNLPVIDSIPEVQISAADKKRQPTEWTDYLNPFNWGAPNYDDKGTFRQAFRQARINKENDFMWYGDRYSSDLKKLPKNKKSLVEDLVTSQDSTDVKVVPDTSDIKKPEPVKKPEVKFSGNELDLDNVLTYLVNTRGGDKNTWTSAADTIAYHESAHTMNPKQKQIGGGPGRGMFQFEEPTFKTFKNRYKNVAKNLNLKTDPNILKAESADELTPEQQYTTFLVNMIESNAVLGDYAKGDLSLEDLWLKGHKNVEAEGDRESFQTSVERAKKKGIKKGYGNFQMGGMAIPGVNGTIVASSLYDKKKQYKSGGQHGGLDRWFAEKWKDEKTGKPCGRSGKEKGSRPYPACRPSVRVSSKTPKTSSELSSKERKRFVSTKTSSKRIPYNHKRTA